MILNIMPITVNIDLSSCCLHNTADDEGVSPQLIFLGGFVAS